MQDTCEVGGAWKQSLNLQTVPITTLGILQDRFYRVLWNQISISLPEDNSIDEMKGMGKGEMDMSMALKGKKTQNDAHRYVVNLIKVKNYAVKKINDLGLERWLRG